ncbi:hypothetical protein OPW19_22485 [Vibrio europaeus]|uniref:hypothetical protein n=1 Tax=Vibrio europaeus TaxID=300876 RepID=UPI00233F4E1C|nr:hypothetical protein [Vibrio europaeus]MDC5822584.1 hypothetical protein [Vibrio europaeus]MDC5869217.1 hypothetical protein [Vibrio europaeus]
MNTERTRPNFIQTDDDRKLRYYNWWLLTTSGRNSKFSDFPTDTTDIKRQVNDLLLDRFETPENAQTGANQLAEQEEHQFLSKEVLRWIDKRDVRLCFWLWCYIRHSKQQLDHGEPIDENIPTSSPGTPMETNERYLYLSLGLNENPISHEERYNGIISFFDFWQASQKIKKQFIALLQEKWAKDVEPITFPCSGRAKDNQTEWFINYVEGSDLPLNWLPSAYAKEERYPTCTALVDYFWTNRDSDSKRYFLTKLKKAWSQQKHRAQMDQKNQKGYNFVMDINVGDMLTEMAKKHETPKNKLLEQLIKNEYSNYLYAEHDKQKGRSSSKEKNRS